MKLDQDLQLVPFVSKWSSVFDDDMAEEAAVNVDVVINNVVENYELVALCDVLSVISSVGRDVDYTLS